MPFFIDGFDYGSGGGANGGSYKWSNPTHLLARALVSGRQPGGWAANWTATDGGNAWSTIQSGSSQYWAVGFDIMPTGGLTQDQMILRFESAPSSGDGSNSSTTLAVVMRHDGTLAFYGSGQGTNETPGVLLSTTTPGMALNQWTYVEILIKFGPAGSIEARFEDVDVLSDLNVHIDDGINPDRITRFWKGYVVPGGGAGYSLDNLYVATGVNDPFGNPRTFLGPSRVTAHFPSSDAVPPQWARNSGSSDAAAVGINGTVSRIGTTYADGATGQQDWFQFAKPDCYGLIYAVQACCGVQEKLSVANGGIAMNVRPNGGASITEVGAAPVNSPSYQIFTGASEASILSPSARWNDAEIANAYWGMLASPSPGYPPGSVRCSQFFLEKLVALRNLPFTCGGGSYSW